MAPGWIVALAARYDPAENLAMQGQVRARHNTINGHLKNWGILSQVFHHDIRHHREVFLACAVIMQITIEDGKPLFEVEYDDKRSINSIVNILPIIVFFTSSVFR